jgi:DNA-binding LacI/PurR family transcriptional regulator
MVGDIGVEKKFAEEPRTVLCDLIDPEFLDGMIVAQFWGSEAWFKRFYARYQPLPVVVVGRHYARYSGLKGDGNRGLEELVQHLIVEHGYRHLGYLRAQKNEVEESRYQTYRECLARHGITADPRLVTPLGTPLLSHAEIGKAGVSFFFDQHRLVPGRDLEVIIAYDDEIALGALEALQSRGIQVPDDVALTGFDSRQEAAFSTPPLTTTSNARYEHGWEAVEGLLAALTGQTDIFHKHLTLRPLFRQSCGCLPASVNRAGFLPVTSDKDTAITDAESGTTRAEAHMRLAYTDVGRLPLDQRAPSAPVQPYVPFGILLDRDQQVAVVVEALFFGQRQSGFVLFEVGPREGAVYNQHRCSMGPSVAFML